MNADFEAAIWDDVDISTFGGSVLVPRGIYMVTIMHNERGRRDGAQLARIDVEGEQPIRLTETQFELLDGTPYFERC
jgi:hypothetical protein